MVGGTGGVDPAEAGRRAERMYAADTGRIHTHQLHLVSTQFQSFQAATQDGATLFDKMRGDNSLPQKVREVCHHCHEQCSKIQTDVQDVLKEIRYLEDIVKPK